MKRLPLLLLLLPACAPTIAIESGTLSCAEADDCPAELLCAPALGRCVTPNSACVSDEDALANGTPCEEVAEGVCFDGVCVAPFCGDGRVDVTQEECDPAVGGGGCNIDCTLAACGNGVIDGRETCDDESEECRACVVSCGEVLQSSVIAECDGDISDACECDPERRLLSPAELELPLNSGSSSFGSVVYFRYANRVAFSYDHATGTLREGPEGLREVTVSTSSGTVYGLFVADDENSVLLQRVDALTLLPEELLFTINTLSPFVTDDETFYLSDRDGLLVLHLDGTADRIPGVAARSELHLCGGALLVDDDDVSQLSILDPGATTLRVLERDVPDQRIDAACHGDEPVWVTDAALFTERDGQRVALMSLPFGRGNLFASLAVVGDDGYVTIAPAGTGAVYAFSFSDFVLRPVIMGELVGAAEGVVVSWFTEESAGVYAHSVPTFTASD